MGLITTRLTIRGPRKRRKVDALFDSGSTRSFIRASVARSLGPFVELPEPEKYEMMRGSFRVGEGCVVSVTLGRHRLATLVRVVENLTEELVLGADFLQEWHIRLDPKRHRVLLDPKALRLKAISAR